MSINHDHIRLYIWLVVWNIFIFVPYIGNVIIPTDFPIFQRGRSTTNQIYDYPWWIISIMNHFQILLYIHYESSNRIHNSMDIYIYIPVSPIISKVHHQIRLTVSHQIWGARASPPEHPWMSFRRHAVRVIEFTSIVILYYIVLYYIILYFII